MAKIKNAGLYRKLGLDPKTMDSIDRAENPKLSKQLKQDLGLAPTGRVSQSRTVAQAEKKLGLSGFKGRANNSKADSNSRSASIRKADKAKPMKLGNSKAMKKK